MTKKRKIFLLIYGIVIFIVLISIMFLIPDSFFKAKYDDIPIPESLKEKTEIKEFTSYEEQIDNLLKNKYEYEYNLLDSMGITSYKYECTGKKDDTIESGSCTKPEKVSYTEKNKKDVLSKLDINYIEANYIFNTLLKEIKPVETKYTNYREYKYNLKIKKLDTDIIVSTDKETITSIYISNAYMNYIIKYSNVSY